MSQSQIDDVSEVWKRHWEDSGMRPDMSLRGRLLRNYIAAVGGLSSTRYILRAVIRELGDVRGLKILDAGSGTGLNSLALSKRGADVTLLDISPRALEIARVYYAEQKLTAQTVEGSIFALPFQDASFDVVWNTGVIEHFEPADRKRAVAEMLRVMRPKGKVLTINPNARARVYRFAKAYAEKQKIWDVGVELPIETLAGDIDPTQFDLRETEEGWFLQFHFLKFFFPKPIRWVPILLHELIQNLVGFLNRYPGYLRTTVLERRH